MEVRNATRKMANSKAAGENNVPLEGYQYLSDDNFSHLYDVVVELWRGNDDQPEFHKAKLCVIEKKGDLHLPKNSRPICLLDVAPKVISIIIGMMEYTEADLSDHELRLFHQTFQASKLQRWPT